MLQHTIDSIFVVIFFESESCFADKCTKLCVNGNGLKRLRSIIDRDNVMRYEMYSNRFCNGMRNA